ncbi:MAG TPA: GvpL/GvpF family gas vesicle protein [Lamprocystis sp. (in: g-proteobacteria)]|nr:GvpL/GvpF family gas vesicle protein [Lamprocystis sp. (in: g-proteobacteria)]
MSALYCFCFAPPGLTTDLGFDACGWEDPVYISAVAGLSAVVSEVPPGRFAGAEAEGRLADLHWLMPRVEAHDRVINAIRASATVFPLTFGTLFSTPQALAGEVARRRRTLLNFFERMNGREEWAVKVLLDHDQALAGRARELFPEETVASVGGRGYLLRQRRKVQAEQAIGPWVDQVVADLDQRLVKSCEAVLSRPARDPAVANRACLIATGGAAALCAEIDRMGAAYAQQGIDLHCSGPWPLYSFCAVS